MVGIPINRYLRRPLNHGLVMDYTINIINRLFYGITTTNTWRFPFCHGGTPSSHPFFFGIFHETILPEATQKRSWNACASGTDRTKLPQPCRWRAAGRDDIPKKWKLYGNPKKIQWKLWKSYEDQWKPNGNPMEIHEHLKSTGWKFYGNLRKSYEDRWRSYG